MIKVDANRFMQIMNNLLSNAAKFSPPNSTVDIIVTKQNKCVRVAVKDKGHGIEKEFRPLIFQKFLQADSTNTRHSGGTGLGLAITKELVEQMGGKLGFTTSIGSGTSFYFDLPEV
jgi:signal transduction histidine kinase